MIISLLRRKRGMPFARAFTLIELLVVISIIGILAGLLLPVISSVMEKARKTSARSTESQIVSAVNSYQTDYGQYPLPASAATDYTYDTTTHNQPLFDILRALNAESPLVYNPRRIVYFESKNVKNNTVPKDGFVTAAGGAGNSNSAAPVTPNVNDLVDPWGNLYLIRIDGNYTNIVMNPYADQTQTASDNPASPPTSTDPRVLRTTVVVYSWGKDGTIGTKGSGAPASPYTDVGDDVDSWQ